MSKVKIIVSPVLVIPQVTMRQQMVDKFQLDMSVLVRNALGVTGTVMLLHAGYSAFESLTYEKSLDPSARLEIPLDVSLQNFLLINMFCRLDWRLWYQ